MGQSDDVGERDRAWMEQLRQKVMLEMALLADVDQQPCRPEPIVPPFHALRRKKPRLGD